MDSITKREMEVLRLLSQGKRTAQIANELFISEGTVKQHLSHIYRKIGASNKVQAVLMYLERAEHQEHK